MIKPQLKSESIYLLILFGLLLSLGFSSFFSHQLIHDFPQGFVANDAFYKYNRVHYLIESGNFDHDEWYAVNGREDLFQKDRPLTYFVSAIYSLNSGIPDWDAYQFIGILAKIISTFLVYLIIRKIINPEVAICSMGITAFIFVKFNFISFQYGWIPITLGASLLFFLIWVIVNMELEGVWPLAGLALASLALTHATDFYYSLLIFGIGLLYLFIRQKFKFYFFKGALVSGLFFIALTSYYLPFDIIQFFKNTGSAIGTYGPPSYPVTVFSDLGIFGYLVVLGLIYSVYYGYKNRDKIIYLFFFYLLILISNLSLSHSLSDRFYQLRYFWPIIFMLFFGFAIYLIFNLKFLRKIFKQKFPIFLMVMVFLILGLSINLYYLPPSPNSLVINSEMMRGMHWVKENISDNKSILLIYGDSYQQHGIYRMFEKIIYEVKVEDYSAKLQQGIIPNKFIIRRFIHGYEGTIRAGFFQFKEIKIYDDPIWEETRGWTEMNLCSFDYYIIDKISRFPQAMGYNLKIKDTLLKNSYFSEVFSNDWYSILKNNKPGENCVGSSNNP